jgi:hypothetical protein
MSAKPRTIDEYLAPLSNEKRAALDIGCLTPVTLHVPITPA